MDKNKLQQRLLIIAFLLLIVGGVLQYKEVEYSWILVVLAVIVYLYGRIFLSKKRQIEEEKTTTIPSEED